MTPFGEKVRAMRTERGIAQKEMAAAIGVSPAYLSALEHGRRGVPNWAMVQKIIGFFNVIWDEAEALEELARRSDPRVTVDTAGLSPEATLLANRLAAQISTLSPDDIDRIVALLDEIDQKSASRSSSRSLTSQP
ncbi:helix-turn-helix domain-containing protein [Aliihoeflea sp. 2WW]|uniref:helix-turn-helix domain-containing protein n=1 Tax=Aliihoeflea sp. 2WW TaxID=1381123 RepID=UPI000465144B|nr:helix-turn-helix domain-containing protein [Aliihoeflea sp. 2WW]